MSWCPRKQNSYNSGVWLDYVTQTVENQEVLWLPTNNDTKTIIYDTKFLKSSPGRYPPLKWSITKIEDTAIDGISKFTLAQGQFDPAKDNAELMIADYYESYVEPELPEIEETPTVSDLEIVYSGKPAVRAGGGYKQFTLNIRDDGKLVELPESEINNVKWNIKWNIDSDENIDPDNFINKLEYFSSVDESSIFIKENPCTVEVYPFKVKCTNDYSLIGKTFTITAMSEYGSKSITVEVISL
jgi:hypothetical protein